MTEHQFDPANRDLMARLRQVPVFDSMEPKQLVPLLKMGRFRRYEEGEEIIAEGDTDRFVYFLLEGSCKVNVDGLDVSFISNIGDVFGEMGLVDHQPRSATITAVQSTLCLALDGDFLNNMKNVDKLASQALFYRIFSEVLAARIRDANRKVIALDDELEDLSVQMPTF